MKKKLKIIVENYDDGFVAYPAGLKGVIVGYGETEEDTLDDVRSAIAFHVDSFGAGEIVPERGVIDVHIVETEVEV